MNTESFNIVEKSHPQAALVLALIFFVGIIGIISTFFARKIPVHSVFESDPKTTLMLEKIFGLGLFAIFVFDLFTGRRFNGWFYIVAGIFTFYFSLSTIRVVEKLVTKDRGFFSIDRKHRYYMAAFLIPLFYVIYGIIVLFPNPNLK